MIAQVHESEWKGLEGIFRVEFNSALPNPKRSRIIGYYGDGLEGFIVAENLLYIGMPYVRDGNGRTIIKSLLDHVENKCRAERASVISIASEERFEKLLEHKGMWKVQGSLYRRNFDEE